MSLKEVTLGGIKQVIVQALGTEVFYDWPPNIVVPKSVKIE
jgi:hypothetical protein